MPKTKLARLARLKRYKNRDPRCRFPFTLHPLGYCWGFASYIDYKEGRESIKDGYDVERYEEFCREYKYWKGNGLILR